MTAVAKRYLFSVLLPMITAACMVVSVSGATPAEYKKRLDSANLLVEKMFSSAPNADSGNALRSIADIQRLIPPTEKIEWPGGGVETDNRWLASRLKDLSVEIDIPKRNAIITEIGERLSALSEAAGDLDRTVNGDQTKDVDKQKLAEILKRAEYQKPETQEKSLFQKWLDAFLEWLAKIWPRPNITPVQPTGLGSLTFVLQILVFAVVIGLIGFLLYRFVPGLSGRFGLKKKKKKGDRVILGERIDADENAAGLFSEAEQLAREGNLRAAIRKGYIAILCDLSDRRIVRLARHKTNRDYLRDVRKIDALYDNLTGLTRSFESNWYGLKAAEIADWEEFRERYQKTKASAEA